jgi:hypothetical protein
MIYLDQEIFAMKKRMLFCIMVLSILPILYAEGTDVVDYIQALEKYIQTGETEALEEFIRDYPESTFTRNAKSILRELNSTLNTEAIFINYLGNMSTTTFAAVLLPSLLFEDIANESLILGASGLIGLGSGVALSVFQTKDAHISYGQELWISGIQTIAMVNTNLVYGLYKNFFAAPPDPWDGKIATILNISSSLAGRYIPSYLLYNRNLDSDIPFFILNSYGWAHVYTSLFLSIFDLIGENVVFNASHLLFPNMALTAALLFYDSLNWSTTKTGLVTVSGIGGILAFGLVSIMIDQNFDDWVILSGAISGKILGIYLTRNMGDVLPENTMIYPGIHEGQIAVNIQVRL